jgi:hypothetical protein
MSVHPKFTELELEAQVDSIMNRFNFEKVHAHMVSVNHQWLIGDGMAIPTISQLRMEARVLLTNAIYSKDHCTNIGTGGFVAYKLPWGMQLTFQLAWA